MIEYKEPKQETETIELNTSVNSIGYAEMLTAERQDSWRNCHINFGPDCENVINALIEFGIIESVDDIWWGEEYAEKGADFNAMIEVETVIEN